MPDSETAPIDLSTPLSLTCGAVLPNRIGKAAMSEGLADPRGYATDGHVRLYRLWAEGGTGLLLTGNIQVDARSLERPGNVRIEGPPSAEQMQRLRAFAEAGRSGGGHVWAQISHAGRQAPASVCPVPVAPSEVPMANKVRGEWRPPRALTETEIVDVVRRFGNAAAVCREAGFTGVQVHGAHGYLINQFLSPLTNRRRDAWGGSLENRARFLLEVVRAVRSAVGPDFPVSLKLNSTDFQKEGFTHEESMRVVEMLNHESLDLLELTGGTYEQMSMTGASDATGPDKPRASTVAREAYFAAYAADARRVATMPIMSTGGFRRRESMIGALNDGTTDLIGLGRPLVTDPAVSRKLIAGEVEQTDVHEHVWRVTEEEKRALSAQGIDVSFDPESPYLMLLFDIGDGVEPDMTRSLASAQKQFTAREDASAQAVLELLQQFEESVVT